MKMKIWRIALFVESRGDYMFHFGEDHITLINSSVVEKASKLEEGAQISRTCGFQSLDSSSSSFGNLGLVRPNHTIITS